jgi:hypothetical protein
MIKDNRVGKVVKLCKLDQLCDITPRAKQECIPHIYKSKYHTSYNKGIISFWVDRIVIEVVRLEKYRIPHLFEEPNDLAI